MSKIRNIVFILSIVFAISLNTKLSVKAYDTILVNQGQTRQVLLGAPILTGKLISGTWSSSNPNVATITSQSANYCNVLGVNAGVATITSRYKYYIGGTYITSSWSCMVEVSDSNSGNNPGGYMQLYFFNDSTKKEITLDLAGKTYEYVPLYTDPYTWLGVDSVWGDGKYYLSLDVRDGSPTTVTSNYVALSENGSPVFAGNNARFVAKKIGSEIIKFQLVSVKNRKFYNTSFGEAELIVHVTCSHKFDDGVVIQEPFGTQNKIIRHTCSVCGETKLEEFVNVPGDITGDGTVNIFDLILLKKYILNKNTVIYSNPDTTGDSSVNIFDLILLKKYILNKNIVIH